MTTTEEKQNQCSLDCGIAGPHPHPRLRIKALKIIYENGLRRMCFDPKEFHKLIRDNPDADVAIVDDSGEHLRTFSTKPIYDAL